MENDCEQVSVVGPAKILETIGKLGSYEACLPVRPLLKETKQMVKGINHVTFSVKNLETSFAFYKDILGFRPLLKSEKHAYLLAGDSWFCLEEDKLARNGPLPEYTHVAFSVEKLNFSKLSGRIKDAGTSIFKENKSEGDSLYFLDPDGHKLEIHVGNWQTRLASARQRRLETPIEFYDHELKIHREIAIQRSESGDAPTLNALALRSKCYWPYPIDYLIKCIPALHLSSQDIEKWPVFSARISEETVGFFALKEIGGEPRLDHLWVDPRFIGQGIGRRLFARAIEEAKNLGWPSFRIAADPFAEQFYLAQGSRRIGDVPSRIKPDLFLPHLEHRI